MSGLPPEQQEAWKRKVHKVDTALRLALEAAESAKSEKARTKNEKSRHTPKLPSLGGPQPLGRSTPAG